MFKMNKATWLLVVALAVVAGLLAPAVHAAGPRLVVQVDESFQVNCDIYQPGELSLRAVRKFSPVATLNEIRVDGKSLGLMLAMEPASATVATQNEVTFERSSSGLLVLASVAVEGEPVRRLERLDCSNGTGRLQAPSKRPTSLQASSTPRSMPPTSVR